MAIQSVGVLIGIPSFIAGKFPDRSAVEVEIAWTTDVPNDFLWPEPWKPLPLPEGWIGLLRSAEVELQSEVCVGHPLYGVPRQVVAFNADDVNEFLFATNNPAAPVAFVHLTYKAEIDPRWPYTVGYSGWDASRDAWEAP
jgi:hypothetical protein